ncbi:MAG: metallophosphoesterase [Proteobacteria bacterium]|nr:metallophosphoesterase [Desulfocapsa sp.]MBU3944876.1 metallophosphoesterase [Pseudomonadota bacterium]MCG2744913.1 metallophosphoesterase [Desulfobacteraceae bacterium]MBU4027522.1 metallophosphoesterase [Pseudomonadota bacterium]MBU4042317.1 metallophosphoesterase [Pseudomonadota bacterium]
MTYFLVVYLSVYSLAHYYTFHKIRAAFLPGRKANISIVMFMAVMITAPILVRLAERAGLETGAWFWTYTSFTWMGLLFLFVTLAGTVDVVRSACLATAKFLKRQPDKAKVSPRQLFTIQAIIVLAVYDYGLFEAANIRLQHIEIASPKIPKNSGRIRIAQISDVHLGLIVREERLNRIIARIKEINPDILVSTGDLVDGQLNHLITEAGLLVAVKPPLGKIAITGNHEFIADLQDALNFTEKAGFTMLRHQGIMIGGINIVGVDDPAVKSWGKGHAESERDLLLAQPRGNFTVLLKHRPDINPNSLGLFDLQLSGHTHNGQIFPFNLLTWLFYPQRAGQLTKLRSGLLFLSCGTGTWGPPIRFLAPPEVTIIDLVPAK